MADMTDEQVKDKIRAVKRGRAEVRMTLVAAQGAADGIAAAYAGSPYREPQKVATRARRVSEAIAELLAAYEA